jgi:hypothetical protein
MCDGEWKVGGSRRPDKSAKVTDFTEISATAGALVTSGELLGAVMPPRPFHI